MKRTLKLSIDYSRRMIHRSLKLLKICQRKISLKPTLSMQKILIYLFGLTLSAGCKSTKNSLSIEEQNQIIETTIDTENDSSIGVINGARSGSHYLFND